MARKRPPGARYKGPTESARYTGPALIGLKEGTVEEVMEWIEAGELVCECHPEYAVEVMRYLMDLLGGFSSELPEGLTLRTVETGPHNAFIRLIGGDAGMAANLGWDLERHPNYVRWGIAVP